jgi:tetratricopeptide (TPR) repeat protein
MVKWYGISMPVHTGSILAEGNSGDTAMIEDLASIVQDVLQPPMVRAAAIMTMANYSGITVGNVLKPVLGHTDPLIRLYAARSFNPISLQEMKETYLQLLHDPVRPVRMEAAYLLSQIHTEIRDTMQRKALDNGIREYERSMKYTADFAPSRHNLGNLYRNLNRLEDAEKEYRMALQIDDRFYPAKVNLANVLNALGKNDEAEIQLRDVEINHPDVPGINYSLGLLLAEMGRMEESLQYLEKAILETPENARIFYNYGLLLNQSGDTYKAEGALLKAFELDPINSGFVYALSTFYIEQRDKDKALEYALMLQELNPLDASVRQYVEQVRAFIP